jgi:iron-sulfur cluster assembly protein
MDTRAHEPEEKDEGMITITPPAAEQIRAAARQGGMEGMALRLAGRLNQDGSIAYGMGFDDAAEGDVRLSCEGVEVIVAPEHAELLSGTVLDYVELEPGQFRFIFMNLKDANYSPPTASGPVPGSGG